MDDQTVHFRHILLYYFRKGKNARQACENSYLEPSWVLRWMTQGGLGMHYKNGNARDGFKNSEMGILISMTHHDQGGLLRWIVTN